MVDLRNYDVSSYADLQAAANPNANTRFRRARRQFARNVERGFVPVDYDLAKTMGLLRKHKPVEYGAFCAPNRLLDSTEQ